MKLKEIGRSKILCRLIKYKLYITISIIVSCLGALGFIDNNIKAFIFLCVSGYFAIFSSFMIQNKLIKNKYSLKSIIYADSKESALSKLLLTLKVFNNC